MNYIKSHTGAIIYTIILCLLTIGVIAHTGSSHLDKLFLVFFSFIIFYFPLNKWVQSLKFRNIKKFSVSKEIKKTTHLSLFIVCVLIFLIDMYFNSGLPGFYLFDTTTIEEVASLRSNIHSRSPVWVIYLSGFNIKSIFPFAILLFCARKKYILFAILLVLGSLYSFGMLQKSFIVTLLVPTFLYLILNKHFLLSLLPILIMTVTISTIIIGSSDKLDTRNTNNDLGEMELIVLKKDNRPFALRILLGMSNRIFMVPGEMVGEWFNIIPSKKPYLWGDGYPILPSLKGHKYINYDAELYPIIRPEYANKGFTGTVNTATFVREYSNFGYIGLVLSSFFVSIYLILLNNIFKKNLKIFLSINLMPLLLLSSSNLWTLMFSGGWILTIMLFIIFKENFINHNLNSNNGKQ